MNHVYNVGEAAPEGKPVPTEYKCCLCLEEKEAKDLIAIDSIKKIVCKDCLQSEDSTFDDIYELLQKRANINEESNPAICAKLQIELEAKIGRAVEWVSECCSTHAPNEQFELRQICGKCLENARYIGL
jgi:hypothetical protein